MGNEKTMTCSKKCLDIPVWRRYTLTIEEAAGYYHIGEGKLRMLIDEHPNEDFYVMNGNRALIKREKFERYLESGHCCINSLSKSRLTDRHSFMAKLYGESNLCYDKSASLALHSFRGEISMSEKRRDNRNRILREGEYQRKDGRYRFRYLDEDGKEQNVYSWRLDKK